MLENTDPNMATHPRRLRAAAAPRLWFALSDEVTPLAYVLSGVGLMLFKYATEALVIKVTTGQVFAPPDFLNPVYSVRSRILEPGPEWLGWAQFLWSLPFMWIAVSMSVRRAANAGLSPWLGLFVLAPLINIVFMLVMCFIPSKAGASWTTSTRPLEVDEQVRTAVLGIGLSLCVTLFLAGASILLVKEYGVSLFLASPLIIGATAGYVHNYKHSRGAGSTIGVASAAVLCGGLALLLFAFEGVVCLAMAAPLAFPLGILGGLIGKAIADSTTRSHRNLAAVILALPLASGLESFYRPTHVYEVLTTVEINAPPEKVWDNVVHFPDLPEATEWYFRLGVASPLRAHIVGEGVGAVRHCEFSTGTFVEPITAWEEPHRLAFDVSEQPAPMFEFSPYPNIHPPHLDDYLRSRRGEFKLMPLADGCTRLEGRTWYELRMFPQPYWTLWSDAFIHRIHRRVLEHVKREAER
jgi:hypothetical protein